jgi:hypothetical protein
MMNMARGIRVNQHVKETSFPRACLAHSRHPLAPVVAADLPNEVAAHDRRTSNMPSLLIHRRIKGKLRKLAGA